MKLILEMIVNLIQVKKSQLKNKTKNIKCKKQKKNEVPESQNQDKGSDEEIIEGDTEDDKTNNTDIKDTEKETQASKKRARSQSDKEGQKKTKKKMKKDEEKPKRKVIKNFLIATNMDKDKVQEISDTILENESLNQDTKFLPTSGDNFDRNKVTHVIVGSETPTYKTLLGIARGLYVVKPEWVYDSIEKK